ncbi:hypothetical protein B0I35DRAFT_448601 [Stachybotrys elegans]|uniref:Peptide hydrolase n=1 Tax=Stachybotrys elegans TaxID=80388 RepID=A0A8K0WYH0_9HYPO|nr:hypothetical protein B0I35DRAFT_448601 [Stachybotrys elegans]
MSGRAVLATSLALSGVSALQLPVQLPLQQFVPSKLPWSSSSDSGVDSELIAKPLVDSETLQKHITSDALKARAKDLYEIAKKSEDEYNHPTRVIGSEGHLGTLEYIWDQLSQLGDAYTLSKQGFPAVMGNVLESRLVIGDKVPNTATAFALTPATKNKQPVHGDVILVKNQGCDAADYPTEIEGNIAFIKRGTCAFGTKSALAGKAGAVAAVVYNNEDNDDELHGTMGTPSPDHVATFGLSGNEAAPFIKKIESGEKVDAIAYMDAMVESIKTTNIVAQTTRGDPENCVMLGAHSDSVPEGPGINDDGSGSMSLLEVATHLAKYDVNNCVRFAWVSGEEEGLLGSDYYVSSLSPEENSKIRLFMDYDMMGSPNYAYQIYNATNEENPVGSAELKELYIEWYEKHGLNYTLIPFDGRSDYDGFIRNGIPGGGIATGAEGVKTKEEEAMFGGKAGEWYDHCYHQLCDDTTNVDLEAWEINTKLIAHSVATYAHSLDGFPKRDVDATIKAESYGSQVKYHGSKLVL